jgi:hypothetical protein
MMNIVAAAPTPISTATESANFHIDTPIAPISAVIKEPLARYPMRTAPKTVKI